jgi:hypothetical protein
MITNLNWMSAADYEKMDKVAAKLGNKYIPLSAKNDQEAKEILAFTQFYRIAKAKILKATTDGSLKKE